MNERIDILVDETAHNMPGVCNLVYESGKKGVEFTEDALEKFVELLIRECCQLNLDFIESYRNASEVNDEIRKYFGVKE